MSKKNISTRHSVFLFSLLLSSSLLAQDALSIIEMPSRPNFGSVAITLMAKPLKVEVANTASQREHGLMRKSQLSDQEGMLFVFPNVDRHCFWMKNTPIPLTVLFIDDQQGIVDVQDMEPYSEKVHCSSKPARFALEINQGWFKKNPLLLTQKKHPHHRVGMHPRPIAIVE